MGLSRQKNWRYSHAPTRLVYLIHISVDEQRLAHVMGTWVESNFSARGDYLMTDAKLKGSRIKPSKWWNRWQPCKSRKWSTMCGSRIIAEEIPNGDRDPTRKLLRFPRTNRIAFLPSKSIYEGREEPCSGLQIISLPKGPGRSPIYHRICCLLWKPWFTGSKHSQATWFWNRIFLEGEK